MAEPQSDEEPPSPARGGGEAILIVDDEPAVRAVLRRTLERAGYRVLEAVDGADGYRVFESHKDQIRLVITDVVMPSNVSGAELAALVQTERPDTHVILSSGYSVEFAVDQRTLGPRQRFVEKPYEKSELLGIVRNCLEA